MASIPLLIVFALLAGLDTAAVLIAAERIGISGIPALSAGIGLHLLVAIAAGFSVRFLPSTKPRSGAVTLGLLTSFLCLLTPVFGCLAGAWLVVGNPNPKADSDPWSGIRLGNPISEAGRLDRPSVAPLTQPLTMALNHGHRPAQRLAAPLLRNLVDRRAINILRCLREQPDARTQLYAQGALSTLFENREHQLEALKSKTTETPPAHPGALASRERLASALLETADAGLRGPAESRAMIEEARSNYDAALEIDPTDAACLFGKAQCLLRLGEHDELPDLYGKLCALTGATAYADRLELAYFGALGNWQRTSEAAERLVREGRHAELDSGQRHFWLTRSTPSPA